MDWDTRRSEYFRAVYERYHRAGREAKHLMLNEFCLNTGYHRKYAIRLLNGAPPGKQPERRRRGRRARYGPQVLSILAAIWEAAGYPWSVRLKALLPSWMPWIRKRYRMTSAMEKQLLGISARQIDRRLRAKKSERKRRIYGRTHDHPDQRPFQKREGSRRSLFVEVDQPALRPLPTERFDLSVWSQATVNIDYHIQFDDSFFSVPYQLTRQTVEVRATPTTIEIFHQGQRVIKVDCAEFQEPHEIAKLIGSPP